MSGWGPHRVILDDFREAYYWLRQNTAQDAKIMSWCAHWAACAEFSHARVRARARVCVCVCAHAHARARAHTHACFGCVVVSVAAAQLGAARTGACKASHTA
jgi:hypothetical protein